MKLGYDHKLFILAFDHRGSFQKKFFGIEGEPDPEQTPSTSYSRACCRPLWPAPTPP